MASLAALTELKSRTSGCDSSSTPTSGCLLSSDGCSDRSPTLGVLCYQTLHLTSLYDASAIVHLAEIRAARQTSKSPETTRKWLKRHSVVISSQLGSESQIKTSHSVSKQHYSTQDTYTLLGHTLTSGCPCAGETSKRRQESNLQQARLCQGHTQNLMCPSPSKTR